MPGLGRKPAPDTRDLGYSVTKPLAAALPPVNRVLRYWNANGWWGDQGEKPQCVGYACVHLLEDGPVTQSGKVPIVQPATLYIEAQKVDEFPGPPPAYDGTSVRAGIKALQARGFVEAYYWATTTKQIIDAILTLGPVVMGTDWLENMFEPDEAGFLDVSGRVVGGHAYLANGVNVNAGFFRIKNSWGRSWGNSGHALLHFSDMNRLMSTQGEAALVVERRK